MVGWWRYSCSLPFPTSGQDGWPTSLCQGVYFDYPFKSYVPFLPIWIKLYRTLVIYCFTLQTCLTNLYTYMFHMEKRWNHCHIIMVCFCGLTYRSVHCILNVQYVGNPLLDIQKENTRPMRFIKLGIAINFSH